MGSLKNKSNLALVLLFTEAKADVNIPMATLRHVLSFYQGDTEDPRPHLGVRLLLLCFSCLLELCNLVLLQGTQTVFLSTFCGSSSYSSLFTCSRLNLAPHHVHRVHESRTKVCTIQHISVGAHYHISTDRQATSQRLLEREEERDVSKQPDVPGCDSPTHHWLPD